jgi:hypothetical protein
MKGTTMTTPSASEPIWYKNQRVWRTVFSAIVTGSILLPQLLAIINNSWPSETLALVGAQALLVQGVITRVMANPIVDSWLTKVGLGSSPRTVTTK